jgi:eukaryotic-like serine/threonine-protein kinase
MLQAGDVIDGKYRIVRLLGEGGMGSVYEGENTRIHRKVAIKVLHAAVASKADVVQRFEREAQAAGRIGSQHIVEVLDLGNLPGGERYMVMEFLEGESLGDRIKKRKRLTPFETAPLVHQLLEGLTAAHQAGIIHRDLKPDNVFICTQRGNQRDFVKVLDFGVSKFSSLDNEMSMTKTGAVMGTPFYMSPEQARGGKIDQRSDLYSVGVVMYQAVTGRVPFNAETFNELVFKIALEAPEPAELVTPGLDSQFAAVISRAMVREANGRFQSAQEFQQALGHWMITSSAPIGSGFAAVPYADPHALHARGPSLAGGFPSSPQVQMPTMPLAQSGSGFAQHPSGSGAAAPGAHGFHQNQQQVLTVNPALNVSQGGLAVSSPQKTGSGTMIAMVALGFLFLGGGAFAAYKVLGQRPVSPTPATTAAATAPPTAPASATASPAASSAPPAQEAAPAKSADAAPTAEPAASQATPPEPGAEAEPTPSAAVARPAPAFPKQGGYRPAPKASPTPAKPATPAPAAAPAPKPTGRVVGSEL